MLVCAPINYGTSNLLWTHFHTYKFYENIVLIIFALHHRQIYWHRIFTRNHRNDELVFKNTRSDTNEHIEDKVGHPFKERTEILNLIFGKDGLLDKTDTDTHLQSWIMEINYRRRLTCRKKKLPTIFWKKNFTNFFKIT